MIPNVLKCKLIWLVVATPVKALPSPVNDPVNDPVATIVVVAVPSNESMTRVICSALLVAPSYMPSLFNIAIYVPFFIHWPVFSFFI